MRDRERERETEREMTGEMDRDLAYGEIDAVDEDVLILYRSETKGTPHASENFWCLSTVESSRVARHSQVDGDDQRRTWRAYLFSFMFLCSSR
jgi:hypothetical protein